MDQEPLRTEWVDGWRLVAASALGISIGSYYSVTAGIVMQPLQDAFGWSRGEISSITAINATTLVLGSPVLGWAVDKFGPRRIALPGLLLYCMAFAGVGLTGPGIWTWYVAWQLAAIAGLAISSTVWTAAIAGRFEKHRGLALGIVLGGHGLTSSLIPPLAVLALEAFGWRGMYFSLAALAALLCFPLAYFFFFGASDTRRLARGKERGAASAVLPGFSLSEVLRQSRFWRLGGALMVGGGAAGALQLHLMPILTDMGMTTAHAAGLFAIMGPATIAGRLVGGYLMDRIFPPIVAAIAFGLPIISCLLIPGLTGPSWAAVLVVAIAGLAAGAEVDTIAVLASRYFGLRCYGRIYAPLTAMFALGYGWAGALGGVVYDRFGSYDILLNALSVCLALSALLLLTLGAFPVLPHARAGK